MPNYALDYNNSTSASEVFSQVDSRLLIEGEGEPYGVVAAARANIFYSDSTNGALYKSREGDGTVEGTEWDLVVLTITYATDTTPGVVQLATSEEVEDGVEDQKVITPYTLGTSFAKVTALQTETNTRISQDNALAALISALTTALGTPTALATPSTIMKRDSSGRVAIADGSASSDAATKGQVDASASGLQSQITSLTTDVTTNATDAATANRIVRRDGSGFFKINDGTATDHPASKGQLNTLSSTVSGLSSTVSGHTTDLNNATDSATNGTIAKRDGSANLKVGTASDNAHAINKGDVAGLISASASTINAAVAKVVGGAAVSQLTISNAASGVIVPTGAWHTIETHASYSSAQNLTNFTPTNSIPFVLVQPVNASHVVTLVHGTGGSGGLVNKDGYDIVFSNTQQSVLYALSGTLYYEVARFGFEDVLVESTTSATYAAKYNSVLKADTTSNSIAVTLPTAVGHKGAEITVLKTNASNTLSLAFTSSQTANGSSSWSTTTVYTGFKVISDGTNWVLTWIRQSDPTGTAGLTITGLNKNRYTQFAGINVAQCAPFMLSSGKIVVGGPYNNVMFRGSTDGNSVPYGEILFDPVNPPASGSTIVDWVYAAGSMYVVMSNGWVYSGGPNASGQLGHGNTTDLYYLKRIAYFVTNTISIQAVYAANQSDDRTLTSVFFVASDNKVYACGENGGVGMLGNSSTSNISTPALVYTPAGGVTISDIKIFAGTGSRSFTMMLLSNGNVYACGNNSQGQLGRGNTTASTSFIQISSLSSISKIFGLSQGGYAFAGAISSGGSCYTWGTNGYYQGANAGTSDKTSPGTAVLTNVVQDAGFYGTANNVSVWALKTNGDLYTWGYNGGNQLFNASTTTVQTPTKNFTGVASKVWAWSDVYGNQSSGTPIIVLDTSGKLHYSGPVASALFMPFPLLANSNYASGAYYVDLPLHFINGTETISDMAFTMHGSNGGQIAWVLTTGGDIYYNGANYIGTALNYLGVANTQATNYYWHKYTKFITQ